MTRTLQAALIVAAAAASAAAEGPSAAHLPAPTAASARPITTPPDDGRYLGFDTNLYPGDAAMDAWKRSGKYDWVGYYLEAACHKDDSWSGKRARLARKGWGVAVIYVGQQTWGRTFPAARSTRSGKGRPRTRSAHTMTRESRVPVATSSDRCSAAFVHGTQGRIDARDAIAMASREGFARGTVIFLDVEHMHSVPQAMREYYTTWARTLLADGRYRPGIYAHTANAATIYEDVNDVYRQARVRGDPPFWIASTRGFSTKREPTDVGHAFASVWQGALDVTRTHGGVRLPVDISVASDPSPSEIENE